MVNWFIFNMGWTKLSLPIITAIVFTFLAFIFLLYTERITTISRFKLNCPKRISAGISASWLISIQINYRADFFFLFLYLIDDDRALESDSIDNPVDDILDFDPDECSVNHGKWMFNSSIKPLYTDRTCPYIDKQYSCIKNGRNDSYYLHWEWKPDDCMLPRLASYSNFNSLFLS